MRLRNTTHNYGWLTIVLHWLMAILLLGLYFVGDYMVDLSYYDTLYHTLPTWHKAIGIIVGLLLIIRLAWIFSHPRPAPAISNAPTFTHRLAKLGHFALYAIVITMIISGYLLSTAKGKGIDVFGWFEFPALLSANAERGEMAADLHELVGWAFIILVAIHVLAALAHHFYFKDNTLKRMLGISTSKELSS